jgi:hypothetical protein
MSPDAPDEPKPSAWPESWQFSLGAIPLVALAVYALAHWRHAPDLVSLLWRDPMGVKMLVTSFVLLTVGATVFVGGCALLNRVARAPWRTGAIVTQIGLVVGWVVLFCAPVAFIVTVGPSAISIQRNMLKPSCSATAELADSLSLGRSIRGKSNSKPHCHISCGGTRVGDHTWFDGPCISCRERRVSLVSRGGPAGVSDRRGIRDLHSGYGAPGERGASAAAGASCSTTRMPMKFAPAVIFASALTALTAGRSPADDVQRNPPYGPVTVSLFMTDKDRKSELRITAEQEKALQATEEKRNKIFLSYNEECVKVFQSKLAEGQKTAKVRALDMKAADDLFKVYGEVLRPAQVKRMKQIVLQHHGIGVFDLPEVRDALKISDKEVKALRAAHYKLAGEVNTELSKRISAKTITAQEAARMASSMTIGVPDQVRALLSKEQQKAFDELHGEKFNYK